MCCEYGPWGILKKNQFLHELQMGQLSRMLHYAKLEKLDRDKCSSLLAPQKRGVVNTVPGPY
jgi:hypothetical protein